MLQSLSRKVHTVPFSDALRRRGEVVLCADLAGKDVLGRPTRPIEWLSAEVFEDGRLYFLLEGKWYEGGAEYFNSVRRKMDELFPKVPPVPLPAWDPTAFRDPKGEKKGETAYNDWVARTLPEKFVNLDKALIRSELHSTRGFEGCDLLFIEENILVHVKHGRSASDLGYVFNQVLSSTEKLCQRAEARTAFAAWVEIRGAGSHIVPRDFRPRTVVIALMIERADDLAHGNLFPNTQVALVQLARDLEARLGVTLKLVAIPPAWVAVTPAA